MVQLEGAVGGMLTALNGSKLGVVVGKYLRLWLFCTHVNIKIASTISGSWNVIVARD